MAGYPEAHPDFIVDDKEQMEKNYRDSLAYTKEKVRGGAARRRGPALRGGWTRRQILVCLLVYCWCTAAREPSHMCSMSCAPGCLPDLAGMNFTA